MMRDGGGRESQGRQIRQCTGEIEIMLGLKQERGYEYHPVQQEPDAGTEQE